MSGSSLSVAVKLSTAKFSVYLDTSIAVESGTTDWHLHITDDWANHDGCYIDWVTVDANCSQVDERNRFWDSANRLINDPNITPKNMKKAVAALCTRVIKHVLTIRKESPPQ